jgi:hypothetical protein
VQPLWQSVWRLLKKLKMELLYDLARPLLATYLKECKSVYNKDIYIPIFFPFGSTGV